MNIVVFGLGASGRSVVRYLQSRGIQPTLVDDKITEFESLPVLASTLVESASQLIVSPGIPLTHPLVLRSQGVVNDIELAFQEVLNRPKRPKVIGITGSNGKTTTTMLLTHILNCSGIRTEAVGNVGEPILDYIDQDLDCLVVELSSFQLEVARTPVLDASIVLNITPNHLDRHSSFEEYNRAKFRIFDLTLNPEQSFYRTNFQLQGRHVLELGELPQEIEVPESHDTENFLSAYQLASTLGITFNQAVSAYSTFVKPPHRIQYITTVLGVRFWDDSKGTTIDATMKAVQSIPDPIVLIAGGVHKGEPYTAWKSLQGKVKHIVTIGKAASLIRADLEGLIPMTDASTLQDATNIAFKLSSQGYSVLLSPGCASYDMFHDYKDRGLQFQKLVLNLQA